jgi:hypothetical protein
MTIESAMAKAKERKTEGPFAFPTDYNGQHEGMTLRDYFAGQALTGLLSNEQWCRRLDKAAAKQVVGFKEAVAFSAYEMADKMLKARKRKAR